MLLVVGTPIGNLGDLSPRAAEALRRASLIVAEDTRRARILLSHLAIQGAALRRLDAHASDHELAQVVRVLTDGGEVALITDAGMPSVSDPGRRLVQAARAAGVSIAVVPGPSAVTAAVALSGLVEGPFLFLGFLARRGEERRAQLARVVTAQEPCVLFESPQRITATLQELAALAPQRHAALGRELTKLHEELLEGSLEALAALPGPWRGELTLVVAAQAPSERQPLGELELDRLVQEQLDAGLSGKAAATELAARLGLPKKSLYARALRLQGRARGAQDPALHRGT